MAQSDFGNGKERLFVNGLWIGAALMVIAGFVLRIAASALGRGDLRLIGVALIAAGIVIGCFGWLGERLARLRRAR